MRRTITVGSLWRLVLGLTIATVIYTAVGLLTFGEALASVYWSSVFAMCATIFSDDRN